MITAEGREAIYLECEPKVRRYIAARVANPQDAEDLTSEVFLKVYRQLDCFDESRAAVSTWVYAITRNAVIDYYRTRRIQSEVPETLAAGGDMEEAIFRADTLEALAVALEALDERRRDIIILRYYRGLTLREIARRMNLSYAYIKTLQNSALAELKRRLS